MDQILIEGLELDCIVGVHPPERLRRQRLRLNIALGLDLSKACQTGKIGDTVDYSRVAEETLGLLRHRGYRLLEVAAHELTVTLLGLHGQVAWVDLELRKPAALHGLASSAGVRIKRGREELEWGEQAEPFGHSTSLLENREAKLRLLSLEPARRISIDLEPRERAIYWCMRGRLVDSEGNGVRRAPQVIKGGSPLSLENSGNEAAAAFVCVCRPN